MRDVDPSTPSAPVDAADVLATVPDVVIVLDGQGRLVDVNPAAERWLALARRDVLGQVLADLAPLSPVVAANHGLLVDTPALLQHVLYSGQPFEDDEMTVYSGDGRLLSASTRMNVLPRADVQLVVWTLRFMDGRRSVFRASSVAMARLDLHSRVMQANRALEELSGYPEKHLVSLALVELAVTDDRADWQAQVDRLAAEATGQAVTEQRIQRRDSAIVWVRSTVTFVPGRSPWDSCLLVVLEDVTTRRASEAAVIRSAADHQVLAGIAAAVLGSPDEATMLRRCTALLLSGAGALDVVLAPTGADGAPETTRAGSDSTAGVWFEAPLTGGAGAGRLLVCFPRGPEAGGSGSADAAAGRMLTDSTADLMSTGLARLRAEAALVQQVLHDPLTRLANRRLLMERLEAALRRRDVRRHPVTVLFVDLDGFKQVNDTYGHEVGDELLVAFAERLQGLIRRGDTASRWGGDEFVLLCSGLSGTADTAALRKRISDEASRPFRLSVGEVRLTASLGAARSDGTSSAEEVLRRADEVMYEQKRSGGGS